MILRLLAVSSIFSLGFALCRFTVRDVGFVDLGDPGYQLYAFVSDANSDSGRRLAKTVFADTNVEVTLVDPSDELDDTGGQYLRELKVQKFPTTVLVHPEGHAIEVPIDGGAEEAVAKAFESIADSKLRTRITDAVLRRYCVVLLVECDAAEKNHAAARAVKTSFEAIDKVFDKMPKDVGALPEMIRVPRARHAGEKVLLWSLGIESSVDHPTVTILTGRGRKFGSNLVGEDISVDSVLGILANAGQSCECGLDRSWMRGTRIPLRWDAATKQLAVDLLDFDPENPLVKAEVGSILAKGKNGKSGSGTSAPSVADMLLGYSEEGIEGDVIEALQDPGVESDPDGEEEASGLVVLLTLGGLLLASVAVAAFVLLRVRR